MTAVVTLQKSELAKITGLWNFAQHADGGVCAVPFLAAVEEVELLGER